MRRRPPSFPLVLSLLVAGAGIVVLILDSGPGSAGPPPTLGIGSSHACAVTRAGARVTAHSAILVRETARAPVRVTESASGPTGVVTVTRSELVSATLRESRPVSLSARAERRARACANGQSPTAARADALRRAYAGALEAAHMAAAREAQAGLRALVHKLFPSILAAARAQASARAHMLALTAVHTLGAQALAEARRRAG